MESAAPDEAPAGAPTAAPPDPAEATQAHIKSLDGLSFLERRALLALLEVQHGALVLRLPDGRALRFAGADDGAPAAEVRILDRRMIGRLALGGQLGFAESYIDGEWDTPDLIRLMQLLSANMDALERAAMPHPAVGVIHRLHHALRGNTRRGSERNIHAHYDLGNAFYSLWLDRTMTYSSALLSHPGEDLETAQTNKYRALAQKIGLQPGHRVLEIGCGWGGFAEFAAREIGAQVVGLTISREQHDFAQARMQKAQLNDKVEIRYCDYRDADGRFDAIASIEMFEAVGERYWGDYFGQVKRLLKPGARAGLQIITIRDDLFNAYRGSVDFIQKYVFPGGMLPSPERLAQEFSKAGLAFEDALHFPQDYAETLSRWRERFNAAWRDARALAFDEKFRRLWNFYLCYCEAGFRTGRISVGQFALRAP